MYLKHKVAGRTVASGSGFVIEVQGDTVILATNRHVAIFDASELPPRLIPKGSEVELEAVFRSGHGMQEEQALPAQLIAAETTDDVGSDFAILIVKGVKNPPKPISVLAKSKTTEGKTYIGAGFPLGGMLTNVVGTSGDPSVTITGGQIAAVRRDEDGQVALFQVDGSLQPGLSGGPIIDDKTGELIGVALAKVGPSIRSAS